MKKHFFIFSLIMLTFLMSSLAFATTNDAVIGWTLDDADLTGSNPDDVSGTGNDGTNSGATTGVTGQQNEAFSFDGSSNQVSNTSLSFTVPYTGSYSVSMCYKWDSLTDGRGLFSLGTDATGDFVIRAFYFSGSMYASVMKDGTGSTEKQISTTGGDTIGTWYHMVVTYNGTSKVMEFFLDNTSIGTNTYTDTTSGTGDDFHIGGYVNNGVMGGYGDADIDEVYVYNRVILTSEISELYGSGNCYQPYITASQTDILTVQAKDADNASTLTSFNVTMNGNTTQTTTNGTVYINVTQAGFNSSLPVNLTVNSNTYFGANFTNWNISYVLVANLTQYPHVYLNDSWDGTALSGSIEIDSVNYTLTSGKAYVPYNWSANITTHITDYYNTTQEANFTGATDYNISLNQSYIYFNVSEWVTGNLVLGNITINGVTKDSTDVFNLPTGNYSVRFQNSSYYSSNISIEILPYDNSTYNIYVGDTLLNVSAIDGATNLTLTDFALNFQNGSFSVNFSTSNGSIYIPLMSNYTYLVTSIDGSYSNFTNYTFVNQTPLQNVTYTFYTFNSVFITFKDQITQQKLSGINITVDFISNVYSVRNYTTDGDFFIDLLTPTDYQIRYSADGYAESSYFFTLVNQTSTILTLYMINETIVQNVTITVYSQDGDVLEGAVVKILKFSPTLSGYFTAEILTTNFAGQVVAPLEIASEYYYFIVEYPSGTVRKTTTPTYIYETSLSITVVIDEPIAENFLQSGDVTHSLVFNNATNNFRFTYVDGNNLVSKGCMKVYRITLLSVVFVNQSCITGANGVVLVGIDNITGATYKAESYIYYNETQIYLESRFKSFFGSNDFGVLGLWVVGILTIVFALLGIWNPIVATLLTPLPLVLGNIFGLIQLQWDIVIGVVIMAGVIIWIIRRKA